MPRSTQDEKELKGMAGEFLVAAELNRRGIHAAVTYGSAKRADVYAFAPDSDRFARIEVKSTPLASTKWVIGPKVLDKANWSDNVFWVLVLLPEPHPPTHETDDAIRGAHAPRFFVFTAKEIGERITSSHESYADGFLKRHGKPFEGPGVIQLPTAEATRYENRWDKIAGCFPKTVSSRAGARSELASPVSVP
jgi:hypothetical protein